MGDGALMTVKKELSLNEKIICKKCKKEKAPNSQNFYENTHPLFDTQKIEVCKECIRSFIGEKGSDGYIERIQSVLAIMDKPFLEELWIQRDKDWAKYIPQLSTLSQFKGLTFKDSTLVLNEEKRNIINETRERQLNDKYSEDELEGLAEFWGKGKLTADDYEFLQSEYEKLLNAYESDDSYAMQILFQEAAHQRLTIKRLREEGKSVDKELKTFQDLLGSANIKPAQETGANSVEQATFGTLIKKYENERPIPEPDEDWKDVDGIKKYIQVWFLGHLCKMLGINNDYAQMYEEEINKHTVDTPVYEDVQGDG